MVTFITAHSTINATTGRQFVQCFEQYLIAEEKRSLIERLLVERILLWGICRGGGCQTQVALGSFGPVL